MTDRTIRLSDAIKVVQDNLAFSVKAQIIEALSALPAVEGWLDISEYDGPPDGMIWGYSPDAPEYRRQALVTLVDGRVWTIGNLFHFDAEPVTYYMPLPAPPVEG